MKSESVRDAIISNDWSAAITDDVRSLFRKTIQRLGMACWGGTLGSSGEGKEILTHEALVFEDCSQ